MKRAHVTIAGLLALLIVAPAASPAVATAEREPSPGLQRALERAVERFAGRIGVQVQHVESGVSAAVDAETPYPMASTFKVPILVELMARVDAGELSLDDRIEVLSTDQHIGSGLLQNLWAPGIALSLRNVATMMIILSDNSATDLLVERLGPQRITARMRTLGLDNIRVDRTTLELILDYLGVPFAPLDDATNAEIQADLAERDLDGEAAERAREAFYTTAKDVASAREMNDLLVRIARHEILTPASCDVILEILERTQTGENRLRGMLPADTVVRHKTGTIGRVVNDVGIIELPNDPGDGGDVPANRFAISVFTLGDPGTANPANERAIADLARTAYDFFLSR